MEKKYGKNAASLSRSIVVVTNINVDLQTDGVTSIISFPSVLQLKIVVIPPTYYVKGDGPPQQQPAGSSFGSSLSLSLTVNRQHMPHHFN
jgi:hypothetical protein